MSGKREEKCEGILAGIRRRSIQAPENCLVQQKITEIGIQVLLTQSRMWRTI